MIFRLVCFISILLLLTSRILPGPVANFSYMTTAGESSINNPIQEKYLALHDTMINPDAFRYGMLGYRLLLSRGLVKNDSLLTVIDFSRSSVEDRFFVIDLKRNNVIFKSLVSHGKNSGDLYANQFSNKLQSHQSALGFYITGEPYRGGQGYSLQINGIDTGYNDLSRTRAIVIHGAGYATRDFVQRYGRLGRSFGCPALPPVLNTRIINVIKGGSVLFSYYPDPFYLRNSVVLHSI